MKNLVFTLLAFGAAVAITSPAYAKLDGGRVEVRAGWDSSRLDGEFSIANPPLSAAGHSSESGFGYGAEAGYDFMAGSGFVIGGYVGADFSSADFCTTVFTADQACLEAGRNLYAGIRAGYAVMPNALIYIKGGYSQGKLKIEFDDLDGLAAPGVPIGDIDDSKHEGGVHLGIGGEMTFGENFYGKIEYVRTNYSNGNFDATNIHVGVDAKRNQVFVGAGVRF